MKVRGLSKEKHQEIRAGIADSKELQLISTHRVKSNDPYTSAWKDLESHIVCKRSGEKDFPCSFL